MWLRVRFFTLLQVYSLIGSSFSSTFLKFGTKSDVKEYTRLKNASFYRGVTLSLSPAQKHEICEDVFSPQLYINSVAQIGSSEEKTKKMIISDSIETVRQGNEPEYPIFLRKTVETPWSESELSISFACLGMNFQKRSPTVKSSNWYHIYSAFHPKWLYSARKIVSSDKDFALTNFITISPDYVKLEQPALEKHYVNTQMKIMALRRESSKYMDLVEKRLDLLSLTTLQRFILCSSILSSPVYRNERLEFSFDWMDITEDTLQNVEKTVSLTSTLYPKDKLKATCIPCKAFEDGTDLNSRTETLYLTTTYDDGYSVIVLKEKAGLFYVDKYFKNIAILITLFEQMDYVELLSNIPKHSK